MSRGWTRRAALVAGTSLLMARARRLRRQPRPIPICRWPAEHRCPKRPQQITASKLDAFLCDVADVEQVKDADGTIRYVRTFEVCDKSLDAAVAHIETETDERVRGEAGAAILARARAREYSCSSSPASRSGADLSRIAYFHRKGLRALQITHHNDNLFGGGSIERVPSGLTPLGIEGLAEMNRLRMRCRCLARFRTHRARCSQAHETAVHSVARRVSRHRRSSALCLGRGDPRHR